MNELDRAICCELANHGEPGKKGSGHHQDSVVVTLGNQPRQVIELNCEAIDDPDQLEHLEIVRRRFAVRFALGSQLAVEVLEEPRRRTHTGISLPGLRFKFVTIAADRLTELAEQLESPLELPPRDQVRELTSAPNARAVLSSMSELAAAAANGPTSQHSRCDAAMGDVVLALTGTDRSMPVGGRYGVPGRHVVHLCMDYADAIGRIPSISELCLAAHVSERRLRKAFVDEYDLPPSRCFRQWALTLAHQRLTSAGGDRHTVTDIAVDLGFGHLGRFSGHYRKLYGGSPSTTLRSACGTS